MSICSIPDTEFSDSDFPDTDFSESGASSVTCSNKRQRLDDFVMRAYRKLKSVDFISLVERGHSRVQRFLSKETTFNEELKYLKANIEQILTSLGKIEIDDAEECKKLVDLTKQILTQWELVEDKITNSLQFCGCTSDMAPICYPLAAPSAWLLENDWRAMAYKEVLSIRSKHSYLLDKAYKYTYREYFSKNKEVSSSAVLRHKKCLNFLASSEDELDQLSKKKCFKWVMECKQILVSMMDPPSKPVSLTHLIKRPNRRDVIYNKVISLRKKYSYQLDEAFKKVNLINAQGLSKDYKACKDILSLHLQFLASSRDDIALLSKDHCNTRLGDIESFVSNPQSSDPAKQFRKLLESTGQSSNQNGLDSANWRDLAYEQLQYKADRFMYQVYHVYMGYKREGYKRAGPKLMEFRALMREFKVHLKRAMPLYNMTRAQMSLFETKDDYFKLVDDLTIDLYQCVLSLGCLRCVLGEKPNVLGENERDHTLLIPKRKKLSHLQ